MNELTFYREFFLLVILAASACFGAYLGMRGAINSAIRRGERERAKLIAAQIAEQERADEARRLQRESDFAEMRSIENILTQRAASGENPLTIDRDLFIRYMAVMLQMSISAAMMPTGGVMMFVRRDTGEAIPMRVAA